MMNKSNILVGFLIVMLLSTTLGAVSAGTFYLDRDSKGKSYITYIDVINQDTGKKIGSVTYQASGSTSGKTLKIGNEHKLHNILIKYNWADGTSKTDVYCNLFYQGGNLTVKGARASGSQGYIWGEYTTLSGAKSIATRDMKLSFWHVSNTFI